MKVGIITFHFAYNYGAVLQAWALQTYLAKKGCEVEIIDYRPHYHTERYDVWRSLRVSAKTIMNSGKCSLYRIIKAVVGTLIENFLLRKTRIKKKKVFEDFISQKYTLSRLYRTVSELEKIRDDYDVLIAGSDQIWNKKLTGNSFDSAYFLNYGGDKTRKLLYGVSLGETSVEECAHYLEKEKCRFDFLSCRENDDSEKLSILLKRCCRVVPDPTFLLSSSDYSGIIHSPIEKNYFLVYMLKRNKALEDGIRKIVKNNIVVNISPLSLGIKGVHNISPIQPSEFIGYIKNARVVVTNSFHGVAFSLLFNKDFVCGMHGSRNSRLTSLLNVVDLENRIIDSIDDFDKTIYDRIDYNIVNKKITDYSNNGKVYLKEALAV